MQNLGGRRSVLWGIGKWSIRIKIYGNTFKTSLRRKGSNVIFITIKICSASYSFELVPSRKFQTSTPPVTFMGDNTPPPPPEVKKNFYHDRATALYLM